MTDYINRKPTTPEQIAAWVKVYLDFTIHSTVRCNHVEPESGRPHQSQLDYVSQAFLNQYSSCVFMASRNAGKSYAAAVVDFLDCWFKPGIRIGVAAYQRNQSDYIYTYLVAFIEAFQKKIGKKVAEWTKDQVKFHNGSIVKFFSGGKSQAGVKGFHPQALQVDEGDLFTQEQFDGIGNALEAGGQYIRRFDVLSTNYTISGDGVILKQIKKYEQWNETRNEHLLPCRIFRVCLLDILEHCGDQYQCFDEQKNVHCPLWGWCKGKAKDGDGFYKISAAFETARDSSRQTFESQMLLLRPSSEFSYFHNFTSSNITEMELDPDLETHIAFDFGGSRCPHAALVVQREKDAETYRVIDEFTGMGLLEFTIAKVKAKYPNICEIVSGCWYDPKGNDTPNVVGGKSYRTTLAQSGFYPRCRQIKRRPSFELLFRLIQPATGPTKLLVNKRCVNIIHQIQAAEHDVIRGVLTEEPSDRQKPDDLLDCLRMVITGSFGSKYGQIGAGRPRSIWF